jgi:hypothetical protein
MLFSIDHVMVGYTENKKSNINMQWKTKNSSMKLRHIRPNTYIDDRSLSWLSAGIMQWDKKNN